MLSILPKTIPPLQVTIYNLDSTLFDGSVKSFSSVNYKGPFDILSLHSNFISIIKDKISLKLESGEIKEFPVTQAVIYCVDNHVMAYLGL